MTAVKLGTHVPAYSHSFSFHLFLPVASLCAPVQKALKDALGLLGRAGAVLLRDCGP